MVYKGFKFGMLLQLAVGPMCLLVFNSSATHGLFIGLSLVLAIALVDLIFITLSGIGVASIINKDKIKLALLPHISLFSDVSGKSIFVQGLLLTASNPLTIIFWSGVFSSQVIENKYNKAQLFYFGLGCVLATLSFLTIIAVLGTVISGFLTPTIIQILNVFVGFVIILFGIRLLFKK